MSTLDSHNILGRSHTLFGERSASPTLQELPEQRVTSGKHIPALDGIRGLAALMVMLFHFCQGVEPIGRASKMIVAVSRVGNTGVALFFVLSGFLITGILTEAKGSERYFTNFYARRALRILPLYYGAIILLVAFVSLFPSRNEMRPKHLMWVLFYVQNLYESVHGIQFGGLNHFWTLAVEEQFYLAWPLVVFALSRRQILCTCLIIILGAPLLRFLAASMRPDLPFVGLITPCQSDGLALGGALSVLLKNPELTAGMRRYGYLFLVASASLLGRLLLCPERVGAVANVLTGTAWAFLFGSLIVLSVVGPSSGWLGAIFKVGLLRWLGRYSYGLYVFHVPLFYAAIRYQGSFVAWLTYHVRSQAVAICLQFVLFSALSGLVAYLSFHLYEKRFLKLKRYFEYKRRPV